MKGSVSTVKINFNNNSALSDDCQVFHPTLPIPDPNSFASKATYEDINCTTCIVSLAVKSLRQYHIYLSVQSLSQVFKRHCDVFRCNVYVY